MACVAGTTNPGGSGGSGAGAHFSALAYNAATGQLAQTSAGAVRVYDPFTAANQGTIAGVGNGFADGLDIEGANNWFSPDVGPINRNGVTVASTGDPTKTTLPAWTGLGGAQGLGWAGVEQVGDDLFAVAVHSGSDTGRSRTIVRFDAVTLDLEGYDPDGDPAASRWEDLAFDGRYLYAADLRGNANQGLMGDLFVGDIYVFELVGGLDPDPTPAPASLALFGLGILGVAALRRR